MLCSPWCHPRALPGAAQLRMGWNCLKHDYSSILNQLGLLHHHILKHGSTAANRTVLSQVMRSWQSSLQQSSEMQTIWEMMTSVRACSTRARHPEILWQFIMPFLCEKSSQFKKNSIEIQTHVSFLILQCFSCISDCSPPTPMIRGMSLHILLPLPRHRCDLHNQVQTVTIL